jgi:hypothetical protein
MSLIKRKKVTEVFEESLAPGEPGWLEFVQSMETTVETGVSYPNESGYAPGTYPQAQAEGTQFDKPGKIAQISSGPTEELKAKADQKERQREQAARLALAVEKEKARVAALFAAEGNPYEDQG